MLVIRSFARLVCNFIRASEQHEQGELLAGAKAKPILTFLGWAEKHGDGQGWDNDDNKPY